MFYHIFSSLCSIYYGFVMKKKKTISSFRCSFLLQVWDHETLQCIMTLKGHNDVVTSFLCWDQYLFSSSLDCMVKVWAATEEGSLEVVYTHNEEHVCFIITITLLRCVLHFFGSVALGYGYIFSSLIH